MFVVVGGAVTQLSLVSDSDSRNTEYLGRKTRSQQPKKLILFGECSLQLNVNINESIKLTGWECKSGASALSGLVR